jgi:hypothetical protein
MNWRTSTVVAICEGIRYTDDYAALPILADALQDADYDNEEILTQLRNPNLSRIQADRLVSIVYSEETADAVKWIDELAETLGHNYGYSSYEDDKNIVDEMNYEFIMQAAQNYHENDDVTVQHGDESWRDRFHGKIVADFWERYELITRVHVKDNDKYGFFGCSC